MSNQVILWVGLVSLNWLTSTKESKLINCIYCR